MIIIIIIEQSKTCFAHVLSYIEIIYLIWNSINFELNYIDYDSFKSCFFYFCLVLYVHFVVKILYPLDDINGVVKTRLITQD